MDWEFWAFTLDIIGKILVAYMAIRVHQRVWLEHKIDESVFRAMSREKNYAILGIAFMIMGYTIHIIDLYYGIF